MKAGYDCAAIDNFVTIWTEAYDDGNVFSDDISTNIKEKVTRNLHH